jgi:hypothetical protein
MRQAGDARAVDIGLSGVERAERVGMIVVVMRLRALKPEETNVRVLNARETTDREVLEATYPGVGVFEVTATILDKNNPDANQTIKTASGDTGTVTWDDLPVNGDGVTVDRVPYIGTLARREGHLKHYVTIDREDPRFSVAMPEFRQVAHVGEVWAICYDGCGGAAMFRLGGGVDPRVVAADPDALRVRLLAPLRPVQPRAVGAHHALPATIVVPSNEEDELLQRLVQWLATKGIEAGHRRYAVAGGGPLVSDLVVEALSLLGEAKASADRDHVRMALGQLVDYGRFEVDLRHRVVILPTRPFDDLLDLIATAGCSVLFETAADGWSARGRLSEDDAWRALQP